VSECLHQLIVAHLSSTKHTQHALYTHYTLWATKTCHNFCPLSLPIVDRFSKFFHQHAPWTIKEFSKLFNIWRRYWQKLVGTFSWPTV